MTQETNVHYTQLRFGTRIWPRLESGAANISQLVYEPCIKRSLPDYDSFDLISHHRDSVIDVKRGAKNFIFKVVKLRSSHGRNLANEANWINHLLSNGMNVPKLVRSPSGNLVEMIDQTDGPVVCYCYEKMAIQSDARCWLDPSFVVGLGHSMGKMHRLAEAFPSHWQEAYPCWDSEPCMSDPERLFHPSQTKIVGAICDLKQRISSLEKSEHSFGLIHDDLHSGNVFETNGNIAILDFECVHRSWFLADIASALLFRVWIGPQKNEIEVLTMAKQFLVNLLSGYLDEHELVNDWRAQMPLFLRLREIKLYGSMYAGQSLSGSYQGSLFHYVYRSISEDRPFLDLDFENVAV